MREKDEAKAATALLRELLAGDVAGLAAVECLLRYEGTLRRANAEQRTRVEELERKLTSQTERLTKAERLVELTQQANDRLGAALKSPPVAAAAPTPLTDEQLRAKERVLAQVRLERLQIVEPEIHGTARQRRQRVADLQRLVKHYMSVIWDEIETARLENWSSDKPVGITLHQDYFAPSYTADEYTLLGMVIKCAGLAGVQVRVMGKNNEQVQHGPSMERLRRMEPLAADDSPTVLDRAHLPNQEPHGQESQ